LAFSHLPLLTPCIHSIKEFHTYIIKSNLAPGLLKAVYTLLHAGPIPFPSLEHMEHRMGQSWRLIFNASMPPSICVISFMKTLYK